MQHPHRELTELQRKRLAAASIVIFIVFFAVIFWFVGRPLVQFVSQPEAFRDWVDSMGVWSRLAFIGMMALQIFVAVIPGEPLEMGAGYAFGSIQGTVLCLLGAALGSILVVLFVRYFGVKAVEVFFSREKIQSLRFLQNKQRRNTLFFTLFFIPGTPKDILTYVAGLTDIRLGTWLLITTPARIPSIITSTISGRKVTINVPASYAEAGADPFFFDFTISDGASLEAGSATLINGGDKEMSTDNKVINSAANNSTNPAFTVTYNSGDKKYELRLGSSTGTVISALTVKAENNVTVPYTVEVKVNAAETGALLTSVKVGNTNAVINNTAKTVTVALPYGTNLGSLPLTIEASKLATVTVGGYASFENGDAVSLVRPLKITVVSEDNATTNVYTLTATTASQFTDVQPGDWYYDNVMDAVAAGIVSGRGDGTFGPNDRITRRDFAIMVSKLLLDGEDAPEATTTPFSDVAANDYGLNAIAYCAENGIISGFDGEFRPGDNITRQEAASVMKNALELTGTTSELFADDAAIATWAKANVYACKAAGVFNGDDNNNFNPTSTLTRAEAASIMVNAMK